MKANEFVTENLRNWFKEKWVRFGPDGKIRGDCARGDDSEGKPKCLPQSKAHSLGKKGRASAAARKRREDPNPERSGRAINVNTKKKTNEAELDEACWKGYHKEGNKKMFGKTYPNCVKNTNEEKLQHFAETLQQKSSDEIRRIQQMLNKKFNANLDVDGELGPLTLASIRKFLPSSPVADAPNPERTTAVQGSEVKEEICPECGGPMFSEMIMNEKQDACYYKVKSRYKVWPSAYASGALVQCRKKGAANWGNKSESVEEGGGAQQAAIAIAKRESGKYSKKDGHRLQENEKGCPPATQDITLNLKNRQKAIDEYGYGPLNPDMPNRKFWMAKQEEWNLESPDEAKQSLCGNCAAFDQREETLNCIAQGIGSDQGAEDPTIDAGDLGYCRFLKFKCASRRTCDAWVTGGPLRDKSDVTEQELDEKWSQKYKSSINCSNPKGFSQRAHCAGKKKNEDQEIDQSMTEGTDKLYRMLELSGVTLNEDLTPDQQFDIIEEMVEQLAEEHGVDAETIWEDFESVDDIELFESAAWRRKEGKSKKGGLNAKGVASYRREHPGSKLQTAVTTKPSKLKPGSKAAKRRKSFCARMSGVKGPMKKPNGKPTRKALALRKWNC